MKQAVAGWTISRKDHQACSWHGPVACGPNHIRVFCKHVIMNTRGNGTLKCSLSSPPRRHDAPISGTKFFPRRNRLSESHLILGRKKSLFTEQWACNACNEPERTNDRMSSLFFGINLRSICIIRTSYESRIPFERLIFIILIWEEQ